KNKAPCSLTARRTSESTSIPSSFAESGVSAKNAGVRIKSRARADASCILKGERNNAFHGEDEKAAPIRRTRSRGDRRILGLRQGGAGGGSDSQEIQRTHGDCCRSDYAVRLLHRNTSAGGFEGRRNRAGAGRSGTRRERSSRGRSYHSRRSLACRVTRLVRHLSAQFNQECVRRPRACGELTCGGCGHRQRRRGAA